MSTTNICQFIPPKNKNKKAAAKYRLYDSRGRALTATQSASQGREGQGLGLQELFTVETDAPDP